jgi:hypothetical protein
MMGIERVLASGVFRVGDAWDEYGVRCNSRGDPKLSYAHATRNVTILMYIWSYRPIPNATLWPAFVFGWSRN